MNACKDFCPLTHPHPHGPTRQTFVPSGLIWLLNAIASATLTCCAGVLPFALVESDQVFQVPR